ncbi:MAG TPA: metallophosphoesterase [Labilithrix sp.]|nr:metallophosphoesterase [Labilithrix sp.]
MWPIVPPREALLVVGAMFVAVMTSARLIQPAWWKARTVRVLVFLSFAGMLAGLAIWAIGVHLARWPYVTTGAGMTYVGILVLAPAAIVLPLSAVLDRGLMFATRPRGPLAPGGDFDASAAATRKISRRGMIRAGAASLPALAAATGASGFASAEAGPRMPTVTMRYEGLHPDLEGFRILHLSDLHLGACRGLEDLEKALAAAFAAQRPDLIVVTGDVADDASLIPGAMELVTRAAAKYGALASLGNHEYLHGITNTRPHFEASRVPLLVSSGRTLNVGGARLFVGGADDPVHIGGDIAKMLAPSIEQAAAHAPAHADFRLLLCHRPEGLAPAAANGFDLTLAGHTHGGQVGVFGRSLLEYLRPGTSWWGTYQRARPASRSARRSALSRSPSRLYTTSGFGHWFPFRLGCPTEMPVIVLAGETSATRPGLTRSA